ncbi:hypothetical protein [Flindersiella endophytica]
MATGERMGDPVTDDAAFGQAIEEKFDAINHAFTHELGVPINDEQLKEYQEALKEPWYLLEQLKGASTAAAVAAMHNMADAALALKPEALNEYGSAIKRIRDNCVWDGGAGDDFRAKYLDPLENALQFQVEAIAALHGLISAHCELVWAAREGALQICDEALVAFKKIEEDQRGKYEDKRGQDWGAILTQGFSIAGAIAGAPAGGALVAGVAAGVSGFGGIISGAIADVSTGPDPKEILRTMAEAVIDLRWKTRREEDKLLMGFVGDGTGTAVLQAFVSDEGSRRPEIVGPVIG